MDEPTDDDDEFDELTADDIEAIRRSEEDIKHGRVHDFRKVAAELRKKYLGRDVPPAASPE